MKKDKKSKNEKDEFGFKDMKGVLFIKVLKAKQNASKKEEDNASQDTAVFHQEDFYSITQPISKIVYLDQEVSSHEDE
jgi:hypothetical protein